MTVIDITDGIVRETIKCPDCGHEAIFVHEEGQTFGFLYCKHCEEEAEREQTEICIREMEAEASARAHKFVEEAF